MSNVAHRTRAIGVFCGLAAIAFWASSARAGDWARFHGPDGSGISPDAQPLPVTWSETKNLKWKRPLPGPGSSSPIVVGQRVFVTCWTGYAMDRDNVGDQKDLRRHLICTKTHVLWRGSERSRIATPVFENGRLHWISGRVATCADAKTGKPIYQAKMGGGAATAEAKPGGGRGKGGGPGGRGGRGGQDYSSPVLAAGKIYYLTRAGEAFVFATGPEFKLLGQTRFAPDGADFSSTPAVSDGELFIRSSKHLYCVKDR